jgi:hypothetical protein
MKTRRSLWRAATLLVFLPLFPAQEPAVLSAELKPKTVEAFNRYVQATEARIERELARPEAFLYVDGLADRKRAEARAVIERGEVYMERLKTLDAAGREIEIPDGLVHHWLGAAFIPGVTLREVLDLVQDYDRHDTIYRPEVVKSRLVSRNGDDFRIFYRLRKKKVITVTLNTNHDVHYRRADEKRWHSRSYTTRIAEVEDADSPEEREKPVGRDGGFLWRLYSYWRFEEKDGGVYIECESVSLTRDIPAMVSWLVKPFITGIPKESLEMTMGSTRQALVAKPAASRQGRALPSRGSAERFPASQTKRAGMNPGPWIW